MRLVAADSLSLVPLPQAISYYSKALENAEDDSCLLNRGITRVLLGETEKALEDFNRSSKCTHTSVLISCTHTSVLISCTHTSVLISCTHTSVLISCTHTSVLISCTHTSVLISCTHTSVLILCTHTSVLISCTHTSVLISCTHTSVLISCTHTSVLISCTHTSVHISYTHTSVLISCTHTSILYPSLPLCSVQLNPYAAHAYFNRANLYRCTGQMELAEKDYNQGIQIRIHAYIYIGY